MRFCDEHLTSDMVGFEWGSGRSTVWFGRRLKSLVSIEHDPAWHAAVSRQLERASLHHVRCLLIPLDHDVTAPTFVTYPTLPAYVAAIRLVDDASLDLVVVDGHYRQACIVAALPKLKPAAFLVVDDTDWLPLSDWQVPEDWPLVQRCVDRWRQKSTSIWQRPAGAAA